MPQIHLRAEPGDYAPTVLLPGDPNRATEIARRLDGGIEACRQVNAHRALHGYTGTYHGQTVSVQTTGMGAPSAAIVVEELLRLGVKRLIRVGTCGAIGRGIRTGDLVIASSATPMDGTTQTYLHGEPYAPTADHGIVRLLVDEAAGRGIRHHVGPVATVDVFYNPDSDYASKWRSRGILAFEMESSVLFDLAARARARGEDVSAGTLLTVSDVLTDDAGPEDTYLPLSALEQAVDAMVETALTALSRPSA